MKKFFLSLGAPLALALVLAGTTTAPAPAHASNLFDVEIVDLPNVAVESCAAQATATTMSLGAMVGLFSDDNHPCVDAWTGAKAVCKTFGKRSKKCKEAKALAEDVCMETV